MSDSIANVVPFDDSIAIVSNAVSTIVTLDVDSSSSKSESSSSSKGLL